MADENRNELNAIVNLLGDVLIELQGIRTDQQTMARTFDRTMTQVVDKLNSIDKKLGSVDDKIDTYGKQLAAIESIQDRLRKLEEFVYNKSA